MKTFYVNQIDFSERLGLSALRAKFPNISIPSNPPSDFLGTLGFARLIPSDPPIGDVVTEVNPEIVDGEAHQKWQSRDFTPEELEVEMLKYRAEINRWRDYQEEAGIEYLGHQFETRQKDRERLLLTMTPFLAGVPIPDGFYWTSADDIDVPMPTLEVLAGLSGAMVLRGNEIHQRQRAAKDLVAKSKNSGDIVEALALLLDE
ncbi:MAG: DUF4376 domain-containing protein [Cellvibrionaceae bacterium]